LHCTALHHIAMHCIAPRCIAPNCIALDRLFPFSFLIPYFYTHLFVSAVHPATWFKVVFDDHTVCTFRPSALMPIDGDGAPLYPLAVPLRAPASPGRFQPGGKEKELLREAHVRTERLGTGKRGEQEAFVWKADKPSRRKATPLLSSTDPDIWVGTKVSVVGTRIDGMTGLVLTSGNGWVQVRLCIRCCDLRVIFAYAFRIYSLAISVLQHLWLLLSLGILCSALWKCFAMTLQSFGNRLVFAW
jgi:hypothetical protein